MTKGKDLKRAAAAAPPPPLDMTAPGKDRHIEVTISKQSTDSMREIGGSEYEIWNNSLLHRTMVAAPPTMGSDGQPLENYSAGLAGLALRGFALKDPVEAMIASQAVALHFASLECSRRAMLPGQPADMASKLRKDAANSARAMIDMAEALDRRRGKGASDHQGRARRGPGRRAGCGRQRDIGDAIGVVASGSAGSRTRRRTLRHRRRPR